MPETLWDKYKRDHLYLLRRCNYMYNIFDIEAVFYAGMANGQDALWDSKVCEQLEDDVARYYLARNQQ